MTNEKKQAAFLPQVTIDRDSADPLHQQISTPLADQILSGTIKPGTLIEDEVSMAARLQVSRPTTRRALQDLVARGLLSRRRGAGTRVTPTHFHRQAGLTSLNDDLEKAGYKTRTDVLSYQVQLASEIEAEHLECAPGTEIIRIERLRWNNDKPFGIMVNLLPADVAPTLTQLTQQGLYKCLEERGIVLANASEKVSARNATASEAEMLQINDRDALLSLKRTAYDTNGRVVEFGDHVYNAARYSLTFTSSAA